MNKQAQLNGFYDEGVQLAYDAFEKQADEGDFDMEVLEKSDADRAQSAIVDISEDFKFETFIYTANDTIELLDENGFEEAADFVSKQAQEALGGLELPAEEEVAEEGVAEEELEEEPTEEEAADAAIQGAAEVVAELTGKDESDPEVQAAAEEIVTEAVEAAEEVAAGEGTGGEEEE